LAAKLVKVAVRVADLVAMRGVSRHAVRLLFLALPIHDVLGRYHILRLLINLKWATYIFAEVAVANIHQFLHQLLLRDFLTVKESFKERI
jgi:hypothetical protein